MEVNPEGQNNNNNNNVQFSFLILLTQIHVKLYEMKYTSNTTKDQQLHKERTHNEIIHNETFMLPDQF